MDDPFKPPKANLEVPRVLGPPPRSVKGAYGLLCVSASLTLLLTVAMWLGVLPAAAGSTLGMTTASNLVGAGVIFFFAWKIRTARNWARWILAIWTALGVAGWSVSILILPAAWSAVPVVYSVIGIVQALLQLAAVVGTFTAPARAWFREASS